MDLSTTYLGLNLKSPLVVAASPLSEDLNNIRKMEDAGASAVVLFSLFEEQLAMEQKDLFHATTSTAYTSAEAQTYFPEASEYRLGSEEYLNHIRKAKEAVKIPIIASLNGTTPGGWTQFAKQFQQAGADAIELNVYYIPTDMNLTSIEIEDTYVEILKQVKSAVTIPVAMKLSPFFTNFSSLAKRLDDAGADALVMFNRFYQPDIDLEHLEVKPQIQLSHSSAARLRLRWVALLKNRIKADLAATSGLTSGFDVLKALMVGANVAQFCSALLKSGIYHLTDVEKEMVEWMEEHEYVSVKQMIGSMCQQNVADPSAFERAQYMKALAGYKF
jgi:dihydroorotate dehydrogenase (fumarate)